MVLKVSVFEKYSKRSRPKLRRILSKTEIAHNIAQFERGCLLAVDSFAISVVKYIEEAILHEQETHP